MTKEEQAKYDLLEANVKAITDRLDIVDKIFAKAKMGIEMQLVFACGASGLYFPADYVRLWGKPYGDGLGPDVCSETLQSNYDVAPPEPDRNTRSMDQIMHPLFVSRAQVDVEVTLESGTLVPVTFQMVRDGAGIWKARNLIVNGLNLGLTFRKRFADVMEQSAGNIDKAITAWSPDAAAVDVVKAKS